MSASGDGTLPDFARKLINLASPRLGSEGIYATDEFFAPLSRMIEDQPAVFIPDKYDDHGKWMDGWETRRRRNSGHDHCIIRLGIAGRVRGVDIDTSHFTGNYAPAASIEGCLAGNAPHETANWTEVMPAASLGPDAHHYITIQDNRVYDTLRLRIFPDGGIARLRIYGESVQTADMPADTTLELSSVLNGGRVVAYNDSHYGTPWSVLLPDRGINMGDGWETRRRREPGNDWLIIQLGATGIIDRVEVDTGHFKGNFPDRCSIQGALVEGGTDQSVIVQAMFWDEILGEQKLRADDIHEFGGDVLASGGPLSHVRLNIFPDGGVGRFRVFGRRA